MRKLVLFFFFAVIGIIAQSITPSSLNTKIPQFNLIDSRICSVFEKNSKNFCFLLSKPVCAVYIDINGNIVKKTFINRCFACKSPLVQYVYDKPCSSYPSNSQFCIPHLFINYFCVSIYKPVCGYLNSSINCSIKPCKTTYTNSCLACLDKSVDYYINGVCTKYIIIPPPKIIKPSIPSPIEVQSPTLPLPPPKALLTPSIPIPPPSNVFSPTLPLPPPKALTPSIPVPPPIKVFSPTLPLPPPKALLTPSIPIPPP